MRAGTPAHPGTRRIARMRAGTPAHPGTRRIARMRARRPRTRHAQDCAYAGVDARAPRRHVVLGSWFLVLGSGCPRTQEACGSRFLVPGSRFGTPAHPGGAWFSVIAGMVRDWCQAGSGLSYCGPPGPCHISGRETETTNSFATTSRCSAARASCSMSCLARNTPLPR